MTPASPLSRLEKLAEVEADSRVPKYLPEYDPLGVVNFGWQGIVDEWMQAGKALLSLLSEPGEACGPHLMIQSSPLSADKEEYVPLTELLQARAALASSEARVRLLSGELDRLAKKYRRDTYANEIRDHACESCGESDVIVPGFLCAIHAAEALKEAE